MTTTLDAYPRLRGQRGGTFYLHGEDHFRKEELIRALVDAHVDAATRDFNLDQLRGKPRLQQPFRGLTGIFERKWYGERSCQQDDYVGCRGLAEELRQGVQGEA